MPNDVRPAAGEGRELLTPGTLCCSFRISQNSQYKLLVRTQKDLLQSQQGHKELTEQEKVFLEQYKAEKETEMLQYRNELMQLKPRFDQAQSDIPLWVRSYGVGRGRSPSLALSELADGPSAMGSRQSPVTISDIGRDS